jgi:hypothetical protein
MSSNLKLLFFGGVAAFAVYNSSVIQWELNKPGSMVCPKCAFTRMGLGLAMGAAAAYFFYDELTTELQTSRLLNSGAINAN